MHRKTQVSSFEEILFLLGLVLLAVWGSAWADRMISSRAAMLKFQADGSESAQGSATKVKRGHQNDPQRAHEMNRASFERRE
jgi:hypothetical protein